DTERRPTEKTKRSQEFIRERRGLAAIRFAFSLCVFPSVFSVPLWFVLRENVMDFRLPELGEGVYEAELISWLVKPGDVVKRGQNLMEVMTDKATMEVPAPFAGAIGELQAAPGQQLKVGQVVLTYGGDKETSGQGDKETRRHGDKETRRHGDKETNSDRLERQAASAPPRQRPIAESSA